MSIRYDPASANPGVRYVRLGYLTTFESGQTLTVGDRIGGTKRGAKLTPAYYALLDSLDPTVGDREFPAAELGLLGWLADQGLIAVVTDGADLTELTMVPVPRREMAIVEELEDGYILRVSEKQPFLVSGLGARFLSLMDGERSLAEIARAVKTEVLADPAVRLAVQDDEREQGRTFDSVLVDEALALIRDLARSGGVSFEPPE